jgi:hypothetical protein
VPPPSERRARARALATVVGLLLAGGALGACGDEGTDRIPAAASLSLGPVPTTSTTLPVAPASSIPVYAIGEQVPTAGGNLLEVVSYDPAVGGGRVAAEVDGCSSPTAPARLGSDTFYLELADGAEIASVGGGKQPELISIDLKPNTCARGWVTFELPTNGIPAYVVFRGSSIVRWSVR